jgi:hypothetical protein
MDDLCNPEFWWGTLAGFLLCANMVIWASAWVISKR